MCYWRETYLGPHRPPVGPTASPSEFWSQFCDEPETAHWDALCWRQSCAERICVQSPPGTAPAVGPAPTGLPVPSELTFVRAAYSFDGRVGSSSHLAVTTSDVECFWREFVDLFAEVDRHDWSQISAHATATHQRFSSARLRIFEIILARLTLQLAAKLAPLLWAPGWPHHRAHQPLATEPSVGSWFQLMLVCHHVIGQGESAFRTAMADPQGVIKSHPNGIWPADGTLRWDVRAEVESTMREGGCESKHVSQLSAPSGFFLYALLWWEVLQWHATKWRLCTRTCSPWQLASPVKDAGFLELVDLIKLHVPPPAAEIGEEEASEQRVQRGRSGERVGAFGEREHYPILTQGGDQPDQGGLAKLLWRDECGRRVGFGEGAQIGLSIG